MDILGVRFDDITLDDAVDKALYYIENGLPCRVVTPNAEIVYSAKNDEGFKNILNSSEIVLPDGIGIVYASRILGKPISERVAGIEFAETLIKKLACTGEPLFLLGAKPGVAETAAEKLKDKYPGLVIAGTKDGYFDDDVEAAQEIKDSGAKAALVCLGSPKQEMFMASKREMIGGVLMIGAGGSLDVFAGNVRRAPEGFRKLGLEWFYRLLCQPSRFWRMRKLPLFIFAVIREKNKRTEKNA